MAHREWREYPHEALRLRVQEEPAYIALPQFFLSWEDFRKSSTQKGGFPNL